MTTIDNLLNELDVHKVRYDRGILLGYLFEFAHQFADYNELPRYQLTYNTIIEWKLKAIVDYTTSMYDKSKTLAYQELRVPSPKTISRTMLEYETKNWRQWQNKKQN